MKAHGRVIFGIGGEAYGPIRMACKEYSSSEIADKLFINVRTVETHRKRIMEKTDSKNFIGVILFVLRHGLLLIEEL